MSDEKDSEVSIDTFRRWTVPVLQQFLRVRNLRTTGRKEELVALVFSAHLMGIPPAISKDDEKKKRALQYADKLQTPEGKLPDPCIDLEDGWVRESEGVLKWPPTMYHDISNFLSCSQDGKSLSDRLMKDYKEGKAYSYFSSGWLKEILYHEITPTSPYCFLKAECTPSMRINDVPHKCWVCLNKKSGEIYSACCTCFAGLGETCNHVAAMLFKVDYAWQWGINQKACTSKPCIWNAPSGKKLTVAPKKLSDMKIMKPHYSKGGLKKPINPVSKQLFRPTTAPGQTLKTISNALSSACPSAAVFQYVNYNLDTPSLDPADDINVLRTETVVTSEEIVLPKNLLDMAESCQSLTDLLGKLNFSQKEKDLVATSTIGQSSNPEWMKQRLGRITSSNMHSVHTKMTTIEKGAIEANTKSLVCILMGYNKKSEHIPSLKYGRAMESVARTKYINLMKQQKHQNFSVKDTGLHIKGCLGASPDGMVSCSCCGSGVLEIKCPISIAHTKPSADNLIYLQTSGPDIKLKCSSSYYTQVQGHMALTNTQWCDFFVYTKHGYHLERILFDNQHWAIIQSNLNKFFEAYLGPEIITKDIQNSLIDQESVDGTTSKQPIRRKILFAKKPSEKALAN